MDKIKILIVGDPSSIHTARFTNLLQEIGFDVRIYQNEFSCLQEEHLNNTSIYVPFPVFPEINNNKFISNLRIIGKLFPLRILKYINSSLSIFFKRNDDYKIRRLITALKDYCPDLIISLKMQNDGYIVSLVKEKMGKKFKYKWIHYVWGTDIEFFGKNPDYKFKHLPKIRKLLRSCKFLITDCHRDARQAKDFGFKGQVLGVFPANGGFDIQQIQNIRKRVKKQRIILVKGRQGAYVGKAFNAILAIKKIADRLAGYSVKIIYSTPNIKEFAEKNLKNKINFEILPRIPYSDLLELNAQSQIAVSASDVDGSPLFLLEAMALGAFPIHSDMQSIREWISNGKNGLLFPVDNVDKLASILLDAIQRSDLRQQANETNLKIIAAAADRNIIRRKIERIIETIVGKKMSILNEKKFTEIYRKNLFEGTVSVSGEGSDLEQTAVIQKEIGNLIARLKVKVLIDACCGDFFWMKKVNFGKAKYLGLDIVQDLISNNNAKYGSKKISFLRKDITCEAIPKSDLILCRDCFVHLNFYQINKALDNFKKSGAKYLLTTTFNSRTKNEDLLDGMFWRTLNLEISPFCFPKPEQIIIEKCSEINGQYQDKSLGLWKLEDLKI